MGVTGYWFMTTAEDERIQAWRERFADQLAAAAEGYDEFLDWWAALGDDAFLKLDQRGWLVTEEGVAFDNHFWGLEDDSLAAEVIDAAAEAGEFGRSCPSVRKGAPAGAFYDALGMADAARMPGSFGNFLLTADEAAAVLPEVERIVAGDRHAVLVERTSRWMGEARPSTPQKTVDGVLRVFRAAAERGSGIAAVSAWF